VLRRCCGIAFGIHGVFCGCDDVVYESSRLLRLGEAGWSEDGVMIGGRSCTCLANIKYELW
jgi:hypothetical protein